jgi:hypothetical protein
MAQQQQQVPEAAPGVLVALEVHAAGGVGDACKPSNTLKHKAAAVAVVDVAAAAAAAAAPAGCWLWSMRLAQQLQCTAGSIPWFSHKLFMIAATAAATKPISWLRCGFLQTADAAGVCHYDQLF